jgi:hypothetical protein
VEEEMTKDTTAATDCQWLEWKPFGATRAGNYIVHGLLCGEDIRVLYSSQDGMYQGNYHLHSTKHYPTLDQTIAALTKLIKRVVMLEEQKLMMLRDAIQQGITSPPEVRV